jgi:molybdopterin molybdotransferase
LISSLREADGLIEVAEEVTEVRKGELVDFIPFTEFGLAPHR